MLCGCGHKVCLNVFLHDKKLVLNNSVREPLINNNYNITNSFLKIVFKEQTT